MAFETYRAQWCFQMTGNAARDRSCNTWHFRADGPIPTQDTPGIAVTILNALHDFYDDIGGSMLTAGLNLPGTSFKLYALSDPSSPTVHRPPRYTYTYAVAPLNNVSSALALPSEVAVCLSFEGILAPSTVRARRRGRVYLGPLTTDVIEETGGVARVAGGVITGILAAYDAMHTALDTASIAHVVYSPTSDASTNVERWWVDDAFDIQRRRGIDPSYRESNF